MKAPSERHLEDWIVDHLKHFGTVLPFPPRQEDEDDTYVWVSDNEIVWPLVHKMLGRQVPTKHGRIDLLALTDWGITVIELKKAEITLESVAQCAKYMYDIQLFRNYQTADAMGLELWHEDYWSVRRELTEACRVVGMVVGTELPSDDVQALAALCDIHLITYNYLPDGEYHFGDEGFAYGGLADDQSCGLNHRGQTAIREAMNDLISAELTRRVIRGDE
jgi:hypothetical protein